MKYITKTSNLLIAFMLVFQLIGTPVYAIAGTGNKDEKDSAIVLAEELEEIPIYDEDSNSGNVIQTVENGTEVTILHTTEEFSYIEFVTLNSSELLEGYINSDYLVYANEIDDSAEDPENNLGNPDEDPIEHDKHNNDNQSETGEDNVNENTEETEGNSNEDYSDVEDSAEKNEDKETSNTNQNALQSTSSDQKTVYGIGIRNPTNVREINSTKSNVITSYPQGKLIELKTFSNNWYEVTVQVNGKETIGYIHHKHIEEVYETQEDLDVVGVRNPTNVRTHASTKSKIKTSYPEGTIIKVKTFSNDWYEVTDNGELIGYIHHKHVGDIEKEPSPFQGVGIKSPTNIRKLASTKAEIVTSLPVGTIINLETFSENWYRATAIVDGKNVTGYVHKKHIGDTVEKEHKNIHGVGINNPTNIRTLPSTEANILTKLPIGSIINLETFSKHWYKAIVTVDGKNVTGYVHKKHIGDYVENKQESFQGIGINSPTYVRERPSTKAKSVKALPIGTIVKLKTFSKNWYEATVNVNGKETTGYVHKKHIGDHVEDKSSSFKGYGLNEPTHIRTRPSTKAESAARLPVGTIIDLKTFSKHWYEATANVNGKTVNGYIHKNHINNINGTGEQVLGVGFKNPTIIRALPSTNASVVKKMSKGSLIRLEDFSKYWYKTTIKENGKDIIGYVHKKHIDLNTDKIVTIETPYNDYNNAVNAQMKQSPRVSAIHGIFQPASKQQVEYYINPSNFNRVSNDYFQFLVLSQPAGLDVNEINKKVLNKHGVLTEKGASFIKAAKDFSINEAYLISHAKLETGNGTSTLAKGVPVDKNGNIVDKKNAYEIVYNVYGIGATDSNALAGGAKRAFEEKWFSVEKAIVGGAQFINTYIGRGQDTLYKMRWNPKSPGYPQYATDVGWAVKQTSSIASIYGLVDNYTLIFDVPKYKNQPSKSGNPNAYHQSFIEVTASALNIRESAGTNQKILGTAQNGTRFSPYYDSSGNFVTKNVDKHVWYKINYNGKAAWVSGGKNGKELVKIID